MRLLQMRTDLYVQDGCDTIASLCKESDRLAQEVTIAEKRLLPLSDRADIVAPTTLHCVIVVPMNEMPCSTPGCPRRVPADSKIHRIVLHDPGTRVLGVLYYCSPCLEHFASYGPYGHFAPRYEST